jgi:hypothetical protein
MTADFMRRLYCGCVTFADFRLVWSAGRAAARDLRDGSAFDADEARRRIVAQLDSLAAHGIRHAALGGFGCGAFLNPGAEVARLYKEELARRADDFCVVAFAIYAAGYGPGNFGPFKAVFESAA